MNPSLDAHAIDARSSIGRLRATLCHPQRGLRSRGGPSGLAGADANAWLSLAVRRR
jgi:hypothetical protein